MGGSNFSLGAAAAAGGQQQASPNRSSRLVQEKLAHHLDLVEVDIAEQVAQKSHHFFEVILYQQFSIQYTVS